MNTTASNMHIYVVHQCTYHLEHTSIERDTHTVEEKKK